MRFTFNFAARAAAILIASGLGLSTAQAANPFHDRVAVGLGLGTEGIGGTVTAAVIPGRLNVNLGVSRFDHNFNFTADNANFNSKLTLGGEPITLSYYPFHGYGFNVQAGIIINQNSANVTGQPNAGGTYTINGATYTAAQVGTLSGKTNFNTVAPYIGVGWGNPVFGSSRWTFMANAGAMYEGNPNVTLSATGAAANPQLASDVRAAQNSVNSKLNFLNWWPVVSVELAYRF